MSSGQAGSETVRIADQLLRMHDGPSWLGPSMKKLLSEVDEKRAGQRPLAGAHTIWELTLHIAAWLRIARERLSATEAIEPSEAEDWPPMQGTWQEAVRSLDGEVRALHRAILELADDRLDEPAPAVERQSFYDLLHGVIQHSAYHAGQIAGQIAVSKKNA